MTDQTEPNEERLTVSVGRGIVQVLQLDDPVQLREAYPGLVVEHGGRQAQLTASRDTLRKVMVSCTDRGWSSGWEQPLWYVGSARAAAKAIRKVLEREAP